jgi:hypothetical protein
METFWAICTQMSRWYALSKQIGWGADRATCHHSSSGHRVSERLTGALLDRLTHHVHILEMNGESYRLRQSKHRRRAPSSDASPSQPA